MRLRRASTTAGRKFAAAVPDVLRTATGAASCLAIPSAKYAAARSSIENPAPHVRMGRQRDRERGRSRTRADHRVAHAAGGKLIDKRGGEFEIGGSRIERHAAPSAESIGQELQRRFLRIRLRNGIGHDAAAGKERGHATREERRADGHDELARPIEVSPTERPGVPAAIDLLQTHARSRARDWRGIRQPRASDAAARRDRERCRRRTSGPKPVFPNAARCAPTLRVAFLQVASHPRRPRPGRS